MSRRLVIEADGASRGNPGAASYGALVRDADTGELLAERAEKLGVATNNFAEYRGLIAGLQAANEIDPKAALEVRMDSKLVVEQMSGRWQIKHPDLRPLAAQGAVLAGGRATYVWVPRNQNKHADRLANEVLDGKFQAGRPEPRPEGEVEASGAEGLFELESAPAPSAGWADPDLGPPTTVILLRHGVTPLTLEKRFAGVGDHDLTQAGRAQAMAAGERLARLGGVDAVVASPMRRTRQTAQAVADALGLEVREDDAFRETDFGEWEGRTMAEIRERWPDALSAWLASPLVAPPGGETFESVNRRVLLGKDKLLARYPRKTVVVVSHVTPIKVLIRNVLDAPASSLYRMELSPASLSTLAYYSDGGASLRVFNDTAHL